MKNPALLPASLTLAVLLLPGCASQPSLDLGQPGKTLSYGAGTPAFDMEALPGSGTVEVLLSIPCQSLTFVRAGDGFEAVSQLTARVQNRDSKTLLVDVAWPETTQVASYDSTRSAGAITIRRTLAVPTGDHTLIVSLEDLATGRTESRYQPVHVRDSMDRRPSLGRLFIQSRLANGGVGPVIPLHIPADLPGLQASARLFGAPPGVRVIYRSAIEQFRLEQRPAPPPYAYSLTDTWIGEPRRIFLNNLDTIRLRVDTLRDAGRDTILTWPLATLPSGMFRISFLASVLLPGGGPDTTLAVNRVISIKPPGFPRPATLEQLIEGMTYIATPPELRRLAGVKNTGEARAMFDSLWLSFCRGASASSQLIRRYYTRMEEANRQFTDLKEGWKTDRGMVYMVMGPPVDVMNNLDQQTWYYSLPGSLGTGTFIFRRLIVGEGETSIMTYLLYRGIPYERLWQAMIARWRECEAY